MRGVVLGGGVTGLAAGMASRFPVYEAAASPGGICSSYYVRPGSRERLPARPSDGEAYRFEIGGGHWIFGGDPTTLGLLERLAPSRRYARRSSVWFPDQDLYVPYPLQNHLSGLGADVATRALAEMALPRRPVGTMREWLLQSFGATLGGLFFEPFHAAYTAGLHDRIAPQDAYKSPVDLSLAIRGAFGGGSAAGYNVDFAYPVGGLDGLTRAMAARARVEYGRRAVRIDTARREVHFADGGSTGYDALLSTLPLNTTLEMAGIQLDVPPDPHTAVLVLNIGARRGPRCPRDHWIYLPRTRAGFHRVGFYDNVDPEFLPASRQPRHDAVSIYVERAYVGGQRPSDAEMAAYADAVGTELRDWGFVTDIEVADPTWIDVAYTWSWPGSRWPRLAAEALAAHGVHAIGRYGRWVFQGIAESVREGLAAGAAFAVG